MSPRSRTLSDVELAEFAAHSAATIRRYQEASGAYPASPTFSAYRGYSWFRDGAFIADGMSAYGDVESAERFHDWCARVLVARRDRVAHIVAGAAAGTPVPGEEMLATRFTFDGAEGSDEWWDFQLDGYGTWLWAVVAHADRHGAAIDQWSEAIDLAVDYLLSSWERPCFDWWEEHAEHVHVSTLGCIAAGLHAVETHIDPMRATACRDAVDAILTLIADRGQTDGHLAKWLGSTEVDASLLSLISPLAIIPAATPVGRATIEAIDGQLSVSHGVHRYLADTFYGGGQWPLLSCFLGLAFDAAGERDAARAQLEWAVASATPTGDLPEQVADHLLFPERRDEWVERWGPVATPLLWSHAMVLRLWSELEAPR